MYVWCTQRTWRELFFQGWQYVGGASGLPITYFQMTLCHDVNCDRKPIVVHSLFPQTFSRLCIYSSPIVGSCFLWEHCLYKQHVNLPIIPKQKHWTSETLIMSQKAFPSLIKGKNKVASRSLTSTLSVLHLISFKSVVRYISRYELKAIVDLQEVVSHLT